MARGLLIVESRPASPELAAAYHLIAMRGCAVARRAGCGGTTWTSTRVLAYVSRRVQQDAHGRLGTCPLKLRWLHPGRAVPGRARRGRTPGACAADDAAWYSEPN